MWLRSFVILDGVFDECTCACSLFDDELTYVDKLISTDVRNNSAWNQRFFVLKHTGLAPDVLQREMNYAMTRIRLVKNNESSWSFLRGLLKEAAKDGGNGGSGGTYGQYDEVVTFVEELYAAGCKSPHLVAFLIDMYEERCLAGGPDADETKLRPEAERVLQLCKLMQESYDVIRAAYWEYVAFNFRSTLEQRFGPRILGLDGGEKVASNVGVVQPV